MPSRSETPASPALTAYLALDAKWDELKARGASGTPEEDLLLCEMDLAWYKLAPEEMRTLP